MVQKQKPGNHRTFARINVRYHPVRSEKYDDGAVGLIDETLVEQRWVSVDQAGSDDRLYSYSAKSPRVFVH